MTYNSLKNKADKVLLGMVMSVALHNPMHVYIISLGPTYQVDTVEHSHSMHHWTGILDDCSQKGHSQHCSGR